MTMAFLGVILSLIVLFFGADFLVKGSSSLAMRLGISPLVVGLTIVALGTSTPELLVSVRAALGGSPEIAVGNAVGSNIFNIGVILGISAIICPLAINRQLLKLDLPILVAIAILFTILFWDGHFGFWEGMLFVGNLVAYTAYTIRASKQARPSAQQQQEAETMKILKHWTLDTLYFGGGLAALVYGSQLLVDNAVVIAHHYHLSETVIGLTIVAAGTGMPELATSVVAAIKKNNDIAVGNVIGSCIYNLMAIMGISAIVKPIHTPGIGHQDNLVMLAFVLLLLPFMKSGSLLSRREGTVLLLGYLVYMVVLLY